MAALFVSRDNLARLLNDLQERYSVLVPVKKGDARHFERLNRLFPRKTDSRGGSEDFAELAIGGARTVEPLKAFCFAARQRVAQDFVDGLPDGKRKPFCLVGAKACDLEGLAILDTVFFGPEYTEPFYAAARQENLVIASDCTEPLEVCFCLAVGGKPFPTEGSDVVLSEIDEGYLLETISERGAREVGRYTSYFRDATAGEIAARERRRSRATAAVEENIRTHQIPTEEMLSGAVRAHYEDPLWKEEAEKCVECGACNTICPTCHCFQLFDHLADNELVRYRLWDSCLIKDFARVAGGANPRPELWMRLRNRFEKKFDYFPSVSGRVACTGCGRCILACPAEIDIRRVLRRNVEHVHER